MADPTDKPKIIIDEDWKSQVEAEKQASPQSTPTNTAGNTTAESGAASEPPDVTFPPASLQFLLTTLATQAMVALGQVPNPITGKAGLRLNQAKHFIDTLAMLQEKTAGNRTTDESALLEELLHQLRMAFVLMQRMPENPSH